MRWKKALRMLLPDVDGIETDVNDLGEAEFRLRENGVAVPARVLSEGTLRLLGLLALTGAEDAPSLVGFEEPENGVHPRRIELIAELLKVNSQFRKTQYIVTTHSPILPDRLPNESLFVVQRINRETQVASFETWGPLRRKLGIRNALDDRHEPPPISDVLADVHGRVLGNDLDDRHEPLPISDRILRGGLRCVRSRCSWRTARTGKSLALSCNDWQTNAAWPCAWIGAAPFGATGGSCRSSSGIWTT